MQRLTWARIRHDQAFRASLRSRPAPPATRIVAKLFAGTVRDASTRRFADPATGWQRRNFFEAEDESTLRIAPGNLVSLPGLLLVSVQVIIVLVQCHAASVTGCERNF
jgi:hypothetical protein